MACGEGGRPRDLWWRIVTRGEGESAPQGVSGRLEWEIGIGHSLMRRSAKKVAGQGKGTSIGGKQGKKRKRRGTIFCERGKKGRR